MMVHVSVYSTFVVSKYVSHSILRYWPVSPCAPATMLGLRFKQDTCIVSPQSVVSYFNCHYFSHEIVTQLPFCNHERSIKQHFKNRVRVDYTHIPRSLRTWSRSTAGLRRTGRFRASLLLHTTCVHSWCNWRASCVVTNPQKKQKKVTFPDVIGSLDIWQHNKKKSLIDRSIGHGRYRLGRSIWLHPRKNTVDIDGRFDSACKTIS